MLDYLVIYHITPRRLWRLLLGLDLSADFGRVGEQLVLITTINMTSITINNNNNNNMFIINDMTTMITTN